MDSSQASSAGLQGRIATLEDRAYAGEYDAIQSGRPHDEVTESMATASMAGRGAQEDDTTAGHTVSSSSALVDEAVAGDRGMASGGPTTYENAPVITESMSTLPTTMSALELPESLPRQEVEHVADKVGSTLIVPEVGMSFESEKEAYEMYNTYAGKVGFSIRKSMQKRRADQTISQKYIVCSSQGHRGNTESSKDTTRTGCNARVQKYMDCQSSTMAASLIQGGYTSLILGVQQDATLSSSARKLHFHE